MNLRNPKIYSAAEEKNKWQMPKIIKILIVFVIFIVLIIYLIFFSPLFKIKEIQTPEYLPVESEKYFKTYYNQNLFLVKSKNIADELKVQYPQFQNIKVYKGIPNILKIEIEQRQPVIVWRTQSQNYLVDVNGYCFKKIENIENNELPVVIDNKNLNINIPIQIVTPNFINFIIDLKYQLKNANFELKQFEINDTTFQVDAITNNNLKIMFNATRLVSDQMDALNQAMTEKKDEIKQYIDVRVEGKVYYE